MRNRFTFIIGLIFLAMPGCAYHGGYYPNGYYGPGPSVLPAQPWTGYPSGPVYQPGSPVYQPGGPVYQQPGTQPGGAFPTPLNGNSPYTPGNPGTGPGGVGQPNYTPADPNAPSTYGNPPGGNNAPTFNPNPWK